jgi:LysR family hydrogen peroxide-inducible transcriptional activator
VDAVLGLVSGEPQARQVLFEEDYGVALPARHPLAERESVAAEQIAGEAMIVRRHCEALPAVSQHFTSRGVRPFMAARTAHDDRALAYVRAGLGITVMPRCFAGEGVAMPRLSGFDQRRRIGFLVDDASLRRIADMASYRILGETLARLASPT